MWDKNKFQKVNSFFGSGFVATMWTWLNGKVSCCLVNIYSPCELNLKMQLWNDLRQLRSSLGDLIWCFFGDFISVRSVSERRGAIGGSCKNNIRLFNEWIREMELVDLPLIRRNFTWYQYGSMSRLDRFLISHSWLFVWPDSSQWAFSRDFSDHCPIVLRQRKMEKGLIPFRFNNCWLKHDNFADLVSNSWCDNSYFGKKAYIIKEKLKALRLKIKVWNKETLSHAIKELDLIGKNSILNSDQLSYLKKLTVDWWETSYLKDNLLRQKSRCKWIKEGDANTSYFHACINSINRRKQLRGISINEEDFALRREVSNYFKNLFSADNSIKPKLSGVEFPSLNDNQRLSLDAEFMEEEIRSA
ncbi:hypothetical protein Lal_00004042, partial [Lupinus albus]